MYRDIMTMCWSIREVNKNLADRTQTADYSIKYLKNGCRRLSQTIRELGSSMPQESIQIAGRSGNNRAFSLNEIAEMLQDPRKTVELNLIDNIDLWARTKLAAEVKAK